MTNEALRPLAPIEVPDALVPFLHSRSLECWISEQSPAEERTAEQSVPAQWVKSHPAMRRAGVYLWLWPLANGAYQYFHVGKAKSSVGDRTYCHVNNAYLTDCVPNFVEEPAAGYRLDVVCSRRKGIVRCCDSKNRTTTFLDKLRIVFLLLEENLEEWQRAEGARLLEGIVDGIAKDGGWRRGQTTNTGGTARVGHLPQQAVSELQDSLRSLSPQIFPTEEVARLWSESHGGKRDWANCSSGCSLGRTTPRTGRDCQCLVV